MNNSSNVVTLFKPVAAAIAPVANRLSHMDAAMVKHQHIYDTQIEKRDNLTVDNDGKIVATGECTIFNATKNLPIAVMGSGYPITQPKEIFDANARVFAKSGINLEGMFIRASVTPTGSRMFLEYVFPQHSVDVKVGDTVQFSIKIVHSVDGSTSYQSMAQGFRLRCLNGMVLASGITSYKAKHSNQLDIDKAARIVITALDIFMNDAEEWKRQTTTLVSDDVAYQALAELSGFDDFALASTYTQYQAVVRPTLKRQPVIEKYMALWSKYKRELGATQWALNNTLTDISTHGVQQGEASITYRMTKEAQVQGLLVKYLKAA
jgi:hypothetical protein